MVIDLLHFFSTQFLLNVKHLNIHLFLIGSSERMKNRWRRQTWPQNISTMRLSFLFDCFRRAIWICILYLIDVVNYFFQWQIIDLWINLWIWDLIRGWVRTCLIFHWLRFVSRLLRLNKFIDRVYWLLGKMCQKSSCIITFLIWGQLNGNCRILLLILNLTGHTVWLLLTFWINITVS